MKLEKRHFEFISAGIKSAPIDDTEKSALAKHFCGLLSQTNGNFKKQKFLEACGVS